MALRFFMGGRRRRPPKTTTRDHKKMKRHSRIGAFVAGCVIALTCAPAHAYYSPQQPNESDLDSHRHYRNHDGNVIHSPPARVRAPFPKAQARNAATEPTASASITAGRVRGMGASRAGNSGARPKYNDTQPGACVIPRWLPSNTESRARSGAAFIPSLTSRTPWPNTSSP